MTRVIHEITMLAVRCRVAVTRNESGTITALEPIEADTRRRKLIEAAANGVKAGRTAEESALNALAFADLWRELRAIELTP